MDDDALRQLAELLPVLRSLNQAAQRLAMALPHDGQPAPGAPTVEQALVEVNEAIDAYCAVTLEQSGLID